MPQILMAVGAILALAGMGSIAAGAPDWVAGLSLGATLIQSGTIAFVGGIVLVALGLVLHALQEVLHRLEGFSAGIPVRPVAPALPRDDRPGIAASAPPRPPQPQGGEAPPRPREATVMQPAEDAARTRRDRAPEPAADEPRPRPVTYAGDEPARPRREIPPSTGGERPRPRTLEQASEELARIRSELPQAGRNVAPRTRREGSPLAPLPQPLPSDDRRRGKPPGEEAASDYVPRFRPVDPAPPSAPSRGTPGDTVVRSGVIGGMAYTLYADGSIEAELSMGTVRFNSIAELQEHVNRTGTEADADFSDPQR